MSIFSRKRAESPISSDIEPELTPRQQTLFIGGSFSVCGNCGGNANPDEETHAMEQMEGEGCGVTYKYVATDVPGQDFSDMRPDLQPIALDPAVDGITEDMAFKVLGETAFLFDAIEKPQ